MVDLDLLVSMGGQKVYEMKFSTEKNLFFLQNVEHFFCSATLYVRFHNIQETQNSRQVKLRG